MPSLGVAVITKNEEAVIERCLNSAPFADKKVVVDTRSTDQTRTIAEKCGARVISQDFMGFPKTKQFAMDQLDTEWILALDADEFLTEEAQAEIEEIIRNPDSKDSYRIPRYHVFMGKTLRHGKGVDYPLRLLRRDKGAYNNKEIHEEIIPTGSEGKLENGMIHVSSETIDERIEKIQFETDLDIKHGDPEFPPRSIFLHPISFFLSYFFKKKAYKDGLPGLIWLGLFSVQIFIMYAKFYEKNIGKKN